MYYHEFQAMNTNILIGAEGEFGRVRAGFDVVEAQVHVHEQIFTRFSESSELAALNRSAGQSFKASPEMFEVMRLAATYYQLTGGLFNPGVLAALRLAGYDRSMDEIRSMNGQLSNQGANTAGALEQIPDFGRVIFDSGRHSLCLPDGLQIDLGGIAKGWIAEQAAVRMSVFAPSCVVDAGGDLFAVGLPLEGTWQVALEDPFNPIRDLAVLSLGPGGVATSSVMKRRWCKGGHEYHHLIDPRTGQPADSGWVSVTVAAEHTAKAEALAKALLIAGPEGVPSLVNNDPGVAFIAVDPYGKLWGSPNSETILQERLFPVRN